MKTLARTDNTFETVEKMLPGSGATGSFCNVVTVSTPINATSTSNAATNWLNPEGTTVVARAFLAITTAGTGTFDMGVSAAATGSNNSYMDGGTLAVGVQTLAGTAGTVGDAKGWVTVGSGSGIVMVHGDTTTSTCVGYMIVQYFRMC